MLGFPKTKGNYSAFHKSERTYN